MKKFLVLLMLLATPAFAGDAGLKPVPAANAADSAVLKGPSRSGPGRMVVVSSSFEAPKGALSISYQWTVLADGKPMDDVLVWPDGTRIIFSMPDDVDAVLAICDVDCLVGTRLLVKKGDRDITVVDGARVLSPPVATILINGQPKPPPVPAPTPPRPEPIPPPAPKPEPPPRPAPPPKAEPYAGKVYATLIYNAQSGVQDLSREIAAIRQDATLGDELNATGPTVWRSYDIGSATGSRLAKAANDNDPPFLVIQDADGKLIGKPVGLLNHRTASDVVAAVKAARLTRGSK